MLCKYDAVFKGVGKFKGYELEIPIDEAAKPVIQPLRRIPHSLQPILKGILESLLKKGVIVRVSGYTPWLSPAHLVPKKDGSWRLCVDMRMANTAIKPVKSLHLVMLNYYVM
jgi:hypothetical protein